MFKAEYICKALIVSDYKHLSVRMTVAASSQPRKTSPHQLPVTEGATLAVLLGGSQGSQVNSDKITPSLPIHNIAHLPPGSAPQGFGFMKSQCSKVSRGKITPSLPFHNIAHLPQAQHDAGKLSSTDPLCFPGSPGGRGAQERISEEAKEAGVERVLPRYMSHCDHPQDFELVQPAIVSCHRLTLLAPQAVWGGGGGA